MKACLQVTGTVQGVGFRPFVFRLASELALAGFVRNQGGIVQIELIGSRERIDEFIDRLHKEAPPISRIVAVHTDFLEDGVDGHNEPFRIEESDGTSGTNAEVPPDIATCDDCLAELFDRNDRRFRYPFLNCTNCGPRFTVIKGLPYDRPLTSMACFPQCDLCESEYRTPANRRFHAQPNACAQCGPALSFYDPQIQAGKIDFSSAKNETALKATVDALSRGLVVAIKGLGGFHLACDATNDGAVQVLRERKKREAKPFAIMMADIDSVNQFCSVSECESRLLQNPFRPIVLLSRRREGPVPNILSELVAPTTDLLGVMLPYTPLQHLLLCDFGKPLVMTSANLSEEPIVSGNREALERLGTICDAYLFHNRDISSRYDDTVTRTVDGRESVVRRARGYAPKPIDLPFTATRPVLAVGGHLKNTFCLIAGNKAFVSQHIGDLDMLETVEHFRETLSVYLKLFKMEPEIIAHDLHPDYGSTRLVLSWMSGREPAPFPLEQIKNVVPVQHHFAHIVSCMVENGVLEPVLGVSFDGIGYGADGNLWGGEFLQCDLSSFRRLGMFKNVPVPGGVQAIKEPWRMALGYLLDRCETTAVSRGIHQRLTEKFGEKKVALVSQLSRSSSTPLTSSCGRLFDGIASLLDLCDVSQYEGHAAILVEREANKCDEVSLKPYTVCFSNVDEECLFQIETDAVVQDVLQDLERCVNVPTIAARFHETIAAIIAGACVRLRQSTAINQVCLSGGVFQNQRLMSRATKLLQSEGFNVYCNHLVPSNDGGISLGQAVAALAQTGSLEQT